VGEGARVRARRAGPEWRRALRPALVLSAAAALALPADLGRTGAVSPVARGAAPAPLMTAPFATPPPAASASPAPSGQAAPPPTARAAPPTTAAPPVVFTIAATGDLLAHRPVVARAAAYGRASGRAYDFGPMLKPIAPFVSTADLGICHLETPLSPDGRGLSGYPVFNVPGELAAAIAGAGYDTCSVASNHALDRGAAGVQATLDVLDASGVGHAGTARSPEEAAAAVSSPRPVAGVAVAHLSYTYGLNGLEVPAGQPWLVNLIDAGRVLADAGAAKRAGARFVVLSIHWGAEYQTDPTPEQRALAAELLASPDVDLILGHHAHVVQPVERIGDEYVVYGLGNFLSNQTARCCPAHSQDGVLVVVTVEVRDETPVVTRVTYHPTWVEPGTYRVLPVARALNDPATPPAQRAELERSWRHTVAVISALGADAHGVVPEEVPAA
jgi:poly-gamma-glutamate capsule biosynthesis protein CapA/YwtB (metallophosphatase superfamily)